MGGNSKRSPKPAKAAAPIGLKAALDSAMASAPAAPIGPKPAEQLDLMPLAPVTSAVVIDNAPEGPRRGPGRPPGSRNKRTEETIAFILSRYRHPLLVLAETYSRPVEQLAREIGCRKAEAFELQLQAAKELAPYVAQKMPQAVELDGKNVVGLTIIQAAPPVQAGPVPTSEPLSIRVLESEQNQALPAPAKGRVGRKRVGRGGSKP